jgi:hypothetical protein
MNPEIRINKTLSPYFSKGGRLMSPDVSDMAPMSSYFLEQRHGVIKRSTWLLDFTDKHPLFYGQISIGTDEDTSHARDIFSRSVGKAHLKKWKHLGRNEVRESAEAMAQYGYDLTGDIINGLHYNSRNNSDHYIAIDEINPFKGYPIKNSLNKLAEDPLFRRILGLIKYTAAQQDFIDENSTLAVFSTLVGLAQSYTDGVAKKSDLKRKQKHVMRDQVLLYALYQYDHGLRQYLEALNEIDLSS